VTGRRPVHVDDEERVATEMGRELEDVAAQSGVTPPAGFADRVMTAIAHEPLPQPARAFGAALAGRRLGAALASIGDAWRVVVGRSTPLSVRAQALALVLVVTVGSLAVVGGATVGAISLLNASQPPHPSPTAPQPSQPPTSPSPSPSPSITVAPPTESVPSQDATETPEGTDGPGATQRTETGTSRPTATEDHGGGSGGGQTPSPTATGTDDHGGGGSGGGGETPRPTATGTDDHGGGSGG
jgi:uncharacterized membrane protein YgcG